MAVINIQFDTNHRQKVRPDYLPSLTSIIEALENFQDFLPATRAAAIELCATELGIASYHFYTIALQSGLGGER